MEMGSNLPGTVILSEAKDQVLDHQRFFHSVCCETTGSFARLRMTTIGAATTQQHES